MQTKTTKMMMTITNDKGKEMFFLVEKRESESLQRQHLLVLFTLQAKFNHIFYKDTFRAYRTAFKFLERIFIPFP